MGNRCFLLNDGSGIQECIALEGEDSIPIITPWNGILNKSLYKYEDISNNGFRVRTKDGECIPAFTPLVFGVNTDVYANCRYYTEPFDYADFSVPASPTIESLTRPVFVNNHTILTYLPSVAALLSGEINSGEEQTPETAEVVSYLLDRTGDINLYIECANLDGVSNTQEYRVNLCVDGGPDLEEPIVQLTIPKNREVVKFSAEEQETVFYISEPSECRWDIVNPGVGNRDESYNILANEMECVDFEHGTLLGWPCVAKLPITSQENKFYIQCKDQPWLSGEESEQRNVGNVFEYTLLKSAFELTIESISPSGTIFAGEEPIVVDLEVKTLGGADNANSICEWGFEEGVIIDSFSDSNGREHHYSLNQMTTGDYKIFVKCEDYVGNIAEGTTEFSLKLDEQEPMVTRLFGSGGQLILSTDEPARCFYNESKVNCGFTPENSMEFGGANSDSLSTPLQEDITYYIKCQDVWGNQPDACSVVVRNYDSQGF